MKPEKEDLEKKGESRINDARFQASMEKIFHERASAFEALARSEREDAAMAPEELALKYPHRR